jgi:hypothetical protein
MKSEIPAFRCSVRLRWRPAWPLQPPSPRQGAVLPGAAYRTGAYAPNGVPWANGYVDYLKLVNARGGINGVKSSSRSARPGTPPTRASSATSG